MLHILLCETMGGKYGNGGVTGGEEDRTPDLRAIQVVEEVARGREGAFFRLGGAAFGRRLCYESPLILGSVTVAVSTIYTQWGDLAEGPELSISALLGNETDWFLQ